MVILEPRKIATGTSTISIDKRNFEIWVWPSKTIPNRTRPSVPSFSIEDEDFFIYTFCDFDNGVNAPFNPTKYKGSFISFYMKNFRLKSIKELSSNTFIRKFLSDFRSRYPFQKSKVALHFVDKANNFKRIAI